MHCASLGLRMKFKKHFSWVMKKNMAIILICHSILTWPSNSWPLGVWVLSVFKLVSCKHGPPGSWLWGPQGLRSSAYSKLLFRYVIVGIQRYFKSCQSLSSKTRVTLCCWTLDQQRGFQHCHHQSQSLN